VAGPTQFRILNGGQKPIRKAFQLQPVLSGAGGWKITGVPCMRWNAAQTDPELRSDPMVKLDLAAFVGEQLRALAQRDSALFNECCSQLAPAQLAAVKQCF
jgi:hypothetical protein